MTQPGRPPAEDGKKAVNTLEHRILAECRRGLEADRLLCEAMLFVEKSMADDSYAAMVKRRLRCVAVLAAADLLGDGPSDRAFSNIAKIVSWGDDGDQTASRLASKSSLITMAEDGYVEIPANPNHWDRPALCEELLMLIGSDAHLSHDRMCRLANRATESRKPEKPQAPPSFSELRDAIRKHVVGLDEQVDCLAARIAMHAAKVRLLEKSESVEVDDGGLLLLVGPSGSGKSHLLKKAAEASALGFTLVDSTTLTAEGYIGGKIDSGLVALLQSNKTGNVRGMYVLDEFDKRMGNGSVLDIQAELLTLVQGARRMIGGKRQFDIPPMTVDTRFVMVTACGVFPGLDKVMSRMAGTGAIGFGSQTGRHRANWISAMREFGMVEELCNRTTLVMLPTPTIENILAVATSENGLIASQNRLLAELGIKIQVDRLGVRYAAGLAVDEKSYIRGVHRLVTRLSEIAVAVGHSMRYSVGDVRRVMEEMDGFAPRKPSESGGTAPTLAADLKEESAWLS
jgi:ATP-dependent Clp protease ATP-binding subunit ClpX